MPTGPNQVSPTQTEGQEEMNHCREYQETGYHGAQLLDVYGRTHVGERAYRGRLRLLLTREAESSTIENQRAYRP